VFSNVYVAVCGAALTAASYALFGHQPGFDAVALLVFSCTLVVYNLDRLVEPHPGDSMHEQWVHRHRRQLWALTCIGAACALVSTYWLSPRVLVSLPIAGAVALGYCLPVLPWRGRWHRLKELPGAKLVLIAGVWTYATALLPMLQADVTLDRTTAVVLLARLLFLAAVALPFDLPDMQRDEQSGIATLPTLLGVKATRHTALALVISAAILASLGPWPAAWAVLASCATALALILALRPDRGVIYFMVLLDGMLIVQASALWMTAV